MLVAGVANTIFGFLVFSALIYLGVSSWAALMVGFLCGTAFSFFTTGHFVFRRLALNRYPRFLCCYVLAYLTNLILLHMVSYVIGNPVAAQAIVTLPIAALSYHLMSRYVFALR